MAADTFDAQPMNVLRSRLADTFFGMHFLLQKRHNARKISTRLHRYADLRRGNSTRDRVLNGRNALGF